MSILRKRISAILLSLAMVTAVALPTFADDTQSYTPMQISAESEAFPQAYIEIENGTTLMAPLLSKIFADRFRISTSFL